jgi:hypothetical protein
MLNSDQAPTQKEGRARIRRVVIEERQRKTLEHVRLSTGMPRTWTRTRTIRRPSG